MPSEKEITIVIKRVKKRTKGLTLPITTKVGKSHDPFKILIATILSPQTKDTITGPAFQRLMKLASTPKGILKLNTKQIEKAIYPVSFYKTKAKSVKKICEILLTKYKGKVPKEMNALLELPGVGRKVAGLVMIYGHGKAESIPVDTHVHKVTNRIGWVKTNNPLKTEKELMQILPRRYWKEFNNTFVKFGQNICLPINSKCGECPISKSCQYYKKVYLTKLKKLKKKAC